MVKKYTFHCTDNLIAAKLKFIQVLKLNVLTTGNYIRRFLPRKTSFRWSDKLDTLTKKKKMEERRMSNHPETSRERTEGRRKKEET